MAGLKKRITATAKARTYLAKADLIMGAVIKNYGIIDYELATDYLDALLSNIVGQQLSGKVANVIWHRFRGLIDGELAPEKILLLDDDKIRGAGLSRNKAAYIKNIAKAVADGNLTLDKFDSMTDAEIIKQLTAIKGV